VEKEKGLSRKTHNNEIMQELSRRWKAMSESEKAKYKV
jgi:hypothetical protein